MVRDTQGNTFEGDSGGGLGSLFEGEGKIILVVRETYVFGRVDTCCKLDLDHIGAACVEVDGNNFLYFDIQVIKDEGGPVIVVHLSLALALAGAWT